MLYLPFNIILRALGTDTGNDIINLNGWMDDSGFSCKSLLAM